MGKQKASDQQVASWIASIASEVAPGKAARIEKRLAKRKRRDDRKASLGKAVSRRQEQTNLKKNRTAAARITLDKQQDNKKQGTPAGNPKAEIQEGLKTTDKLLEIASKLEGCTSGDRHAKLYFDKSSQPLSSSTATKKKLNLQPRRSDYGGLGIAKPSIWISLEEPCWKPRLEDEFSEHIPGFFGKQRTKAMKKQLDGDMLWRKRLAEKKKRDSEEQT